MKPVIVIALIVLFVAGCSGQVQVPSTTTTSSASIDSLRARALSLETQLSGALSRASALESRASALESRANIVLSGDSMSYLNGLGKFADALGAAVDTFSFSGTAYRKALYLRGCKSTWKFIPVPIYSSETPAVEYPGYIAKADTCVFIRQTNGTPNQKYFFLTIIPK